MNDSGSAFNEQQLCNSPVRSRLSFRAGAAPGYLFVQRSCEDLSQ